MADLNENQKTAVMHKDGPCLVLAGPGSGKTRVIAHRIINLVKNCNVNPGRILAISFTKASSIEMKMRTINLGNDERLSKVNFATFHSIFFRILRRYDGFRLEDLISENDKIKLVKMIVRQLNIENSNDEDIMDVLSEISIIKNELMDYREFSSEVFSKDDFARIFEIYEKWKKENGKLDFDDMLIKTYRLLKRDKDVLNIVRHVFNYILIDEFQDINRVQFEIIRLISAPLNNLFVVGDEDQSIYGFRGARPDFMINFKKYFKDASIIFLGTNYRSKKNIVDASRKLISKNKNRYQKELIPNSASEGKIVFMMPRDVDEEAREIGKIIRHQVESCEDSEYDQFAVIYRNNRQARAFVDAFMDMRIPFILKDVAKTIYDHWASLDMISYLKVASGCAANSDWLRIINKPYRYISKERLKKASKSSDFFQSLMDDDIKFHQRKDMEELYEDLNYIRGLAPTYAVSYIRTTLDYDRYILEYCRDRKIKAAQIKEVLDEFEEAAKPFKTIFDFFKHIEEVREEMRKRSEKSVSQIGDIINSGVTLSTMHSSKGLEFDNVFIAGVCESIIPYDSDENGELPDKTVEEERRLMYVAITRAKNNLWISSPQKKFNKKVKISRFVGDFS